MISLSRLWVTVWWETHLAEEYSVSERSMAMVFASWNGVVLSTGVSVPLFIRHSSPSRGSKGYLLGWRNPVANAMLSCY